MHVVVSWAGVNNSGSDPESPGDRIVRERMTVGEDDADQERDAAILRRIVERDPHGVELLYERYAGIAFALAYRLLGERGSAEDVVQEAFLRVWRQGATYDTRRGTVRAWLLTIVHHRAVDQMRSARSKSGADTVIDDAMPLPAKEDTWSDVMQGLEHERVQQAMATLPPEQRQVVDLAYYGGGNENPNAPRGGRPPRAGERGA